MQQLKKIIVVITALMFTVAYSQNKKVGGPCQGCEAIYEYGNKQLKATDTLPLFKTLPNPIKISGTVYKSDGKTPAPNIILYVYHTNDKGIYPKRDASKNWERRHGFLRGWMKTDKNGKYTFYTSRPASYPRSTVPQHIHITVKEPDRNEYYIEDFYFSDDPNLTKSILNRKRSRGGSGIITLKKIDGILAASRNIILGLNIPNY